MRYLFVIAAENTRAMHWVQQYLSLILNPGTNIRMLNDIEDLRSIARGDGIIFLAKGWQHNPMFHKNDRGIAELRIMCRYREISLMEEV